MYRNILIAIDGSDASKKALQVAIELAQAFEASLHAVGVEERLPRYAATVGEMEEAKDEQNAFFERVIDMAQRLAREQAVQLSAEVRAGNAAQQIVQLAGEGGFDLIVLGAGGHSLIRDFLLGTTTDRVTRHAPCSVLVVR